MDRKELNKTVTEFLGTEIIGGLKHFVHKIELEQADIVILIARRALCLFKLLEYLGIPTPKSEIVSDRILDLNPAYFKNKKVVVVDDTLILGSTLGSIKEKLIRAECDVKIFAFCVDADNWQKQLIIPDYVEFFYPANKVLSLCDKLVKAFSVVILPYLVDFPITKLYSIHRHKFDKIIEDDNVTSVKLSINKNPHTQLYTLLITGEIKDLFYAQIGKALSNIIEVIKIRVYVLETNSDNFRVRFVPIVLLKDIHISVIDEYFGYLLSFSHNSNALKSFLSTSEIRLRFIQYYLSYKLGDVFIRHYSTNGERTNYKYSELINIFGLEVAAMFGEILDLEIPPIKRIKDIKSSEYNNCSDLIEVFDGIEITFDTIVQSFQEIFVNLVDRKEFPARRGFKENNVQGSLSTRLLQGLSFNEITTFICSKLRIKSNEYIKSILSICLDICNDMGISVPIIYRNNNCCYRAFRHGELGKKSKNNIYLFYHFLKAFCEANQYDYNKGFDKLLLEKLAVLFYRVGASTDILDTTLDYDDVEAIDVGYYLMGAILIDNKNHNIYPQHSEDWFLKSHCYNLFAARGKGKDEKYYFDKIPNADGCSTTGTSRSQARMYGDTIGRVLVLRKDDCPSGYSGLPLNAERLALLVSCYSMCDIACAIGAELNIIYNWILTISRYRKLDDRIFNSEEFQKFSSSKVYKAFNQALFKFKDSFTPDNNISELVKQVSLYIEDAVDKSQMTSNTLYSWDDITKSLRVGQEHGFSWEDVSSEYNANIVSVIIQNFVETIYLGIQLIYIRYIIEQYYNIINPSICYDHNFIFIDSKGKEYKRRLLHSNVKDIDFGEEKSIGYQTIPGKSFKGKVVDEIVSFNYKGVPYEFMIKYIDYKNRTNDSQYALKKFKSNIETVITSNDCIGRFCDINEIKNWFYEIEARIENIRYKTNPYAMVSELNKTVKKLSNRTCLISALLENTNNLRSTHRTNYVTLLKDKT